jgi:hypothetical protein
MRARCISDPELCKKILDGLDVQEAGFCKLCLLTPSKDDGYIQVSFGGANKFAILQELVLWSGGVTRRVGTGDQISHLCGNPACVLLEHLCVESAQKNNARKGCLVWFDCQHEGCALRSVVCLHTPMCVRWCAGFTSWAEFLAGGVHNTKPVS